MGRDERPSVGVPRAPTSPRLTRRPKSFTLASCTATFIGVEFRHAQTNEGGRLEPQDPPGHEPAMVAQTKT